MLPTLLCGTGKGGRGRRVGGGGELLQLPNTRSKEGVLLRNVSPSLVLCDHFPGGGILELGNRSGKE